MFGWMVLMSNLRYILLIGLMLGLVAFIGQAAGEVDWTDEVTDPGGDVTDQAMNHVEFPSADIRSVSITEQGENINVTMALEAGYNSSCTYMVSVSRDGTEDIFAFSTEASNEFMVVDPSGISVNVSGYYSADGKRISWVVAKGDMMATVNLYIEYASSLLADYIGGVFVQDHAGLDRIPVNSPVPDSMVIVLSMPKMNVLQMKITMVLKGEDARLYRGLMDLDQDGTISQGEVESFLKPDEEPDPSEANVTLDGTEAVDLASTVSVDGGKGPVDSTADLQITMKMSVTFPKVEDKDTHVVAFIENPFGEDFIGGDEPWENEFDMTMKMEAPDGWEFKSGTLPAKMKDYMNKDDDEINMGTADIKKDWNNTFRDLDGFTIEKADEGPGFGLLLVVVAVTVMAVAVRMRR